MRQHPPRLPELVPALSRGRHRNPRRGACFMEMASYLAGERWSDHPRCTHPLLAAVARLVNDGTTDAGRADLIDLIPSVIGVTTHHPAADARISWRCATTALPVIAADRQNVMAVGVIVTDRLLADLDGTGRAPLRPASRAALARAPLAAQWAATFAGDQRVDPERFRRTSAPTIVQHAVLGITQACISDPDAMLRELLAGCIDDVRNVADPPTAGGRVGRDHAEPVGATR
ncbi:MAG: hypothetical protein ACR2HP_03040 [Ilumatobacteraceae bacterium]